MTYQGRIVDSNNSAINGSVTFHLQITDPNGTCVLWDETQTQTVANGAFSLQLGQGTVNFKGGSSALIDGIFTNGVALSCYGSGSTVTPAANTGRYVNITFNDGSGSGTQTLGSQIAIEAVPYSMYSLNVANILGAALGTTKPTSGQVLYYNGSNWVPQTMSSSATFGSGTSAAPSIAFTTDSTTGLFDSSTGILGLSANGTSAMTLDGTASTANISFTTNSTSTSTGALTVAGGVGVSSNIVLGGQLRLSSTYNAGASTNIDFNNGNMQYTTASCGAMVLSNVRDGGAYTLIVQGTTSGTCTFSQTSPDALTNAANFKYSPANGNTISGTQTIYTFIRAGSTVYTSWVTGFQ